MKLSICRIFTEEDVTNRKAITQPLITDIISRKIPRICFFVYGINTNMVTPTDGSNVVCDVTNHVALSGGVRCALGQTLS